MTTLTTRISTGSDKGSFMFGQLPGESRIIEVLDESGMVKGRWVLMPIWHAEFLETNGTIGVARRLWKAMRATAQQLGIKAVYTGAVDADVRALLAHVGAQKLPGDHYIWEMR